MINTIRDAVKINRTLLYIRSKCHVEDQYQSVLEGNSRTELTLSDAIGSWMSLEALIRKLVTAGVQIMVVGE